MKVWVAVGMLLALTGCGSASRPTSGASAVRPTAAPQLAPPTPGTPIARSGAAMAYDPDTGQTVLFGGLAANGGLGDTWVWDGRQWLEQHPALAPHSRASAAMTYDPALHALVLIGGSAIAPIGARLRADMAATWLWTGSGWVRHDTAHSPNSAQGFGSGPLAYDSASSRVVMVVHRGAPHLIACSAATWSFDGTDWHQEAPATPLPDAFVTVVPEQSGGTVLAVLAPRAAVAPVGFASTDCPAGSPAARALPQPTTWRWTGATWVQVSSGTEPVDATSAPELDPVAGASEVVRPSDESVWAWTGSAWQVAVSRGQHPPSRSGAQVSLDRDGHLLLYGGFVQRVGGERYDTWTWSGSTWTNSTGAVPPTPTPSPSAFTPPPD